MEKPLEQVTEWAPPFESIEVVEAGASKLVGMPVPMKRLRYVDWCKLEAKRLRGRVKKERRERQQPDGSFAKELLVAVFV